jgi:hypothetical protein
VSKFHELGAKNFEAYKECRPSYCINWKDQVPHDNLTNTPMTWAELDEFDMGFEEVQKAFITPLAKQFYAELDVLYRKFNIDKSEYDDEDDYCDMVIDGKKHPLSRELLA